MYLYSAPRLLCCLYRAAPLYWDILHSQGRLYTADNWLLHRTRQHQTLKYQGDNDSPNPASNQYQGDNKPCTKPCNEYQGNIITNPASNQYQGEDKNLKFVCQAPKLCCDIPWVMTVWGSIMIKAVPSITRPTIITTRLPNNSGLRPLRSIKYKPGRWNVSHLIMREDCCLSDKNGEV